MLFSFLRSRKDKKPREPCVHQREAAENVSSGTLEAQSTELATNEKTATADATNTNSKTEKCPECKVIKHNDRVYRWKLIAGLMIPFTLAALDLTIVATASPFVAGYFDKLNQISWIATAYTLPSTAFIPIFGQLSDVLGRHTVLQMSMMLMLIGSVLCAAAQAWGMFLLGRAFQGASAAGIMNIIKIVLADKVNLEQNSKNTTIFSLVSGISYSIGPIVGGYLTAANWRYCFVLSVGLSVLASLLLFFILRKELVRGSHQDSISWRKPSSFSSVFTTIDIGGTLLFIFGVGLIIVATSWGGSTYSWDSTAVLVPLVVGMAMFLGFFAYEYLLEPGRLMNRLFPKQVSMVPWSILKASDTFFLSAINFATGAALYSVFYFMGIYFTVAEGLPASQAGVNLLFYLPGMGVGVYLCMFMCNVWPGTTFPPLFIGSVVEAVGFAVITWAVTTSDVGLVRCVMVIAGAGSGLRFMPGTLHGVGMWPDRVAPIMSVMAFSLPFGGTIGLAIMGSVYNNKLSGSIASFGLDGLTSSPHSSSSSHGLDVIRHLPPQLRHQVRDAARKAVMWAFISILPLMGLCVIAALCLGNVWIKGRKKGGPSEVIYSSYIIACFTGTVNAKKTSNRTEASRAEEEEVKS